ncbi:MAG TPA: hypothetical protein VGT78_08000 [Rhizomicrobium sp.]|nr:hypothetical protein [Rhizomicrobium sp.]
MDEIAPIAPALPFEQNLYVRSPFGIVATTAIMFALMTGSFLLVAALEHIPVVVPKGDGFALSHAGLPALVLALMCCGALAMQRYARVAEARDAPAYAKILSGGLASAMKVTNPTPRDANLWRSTIIGLVIGLAISAIIRTVEIQEGDPIRPLALVWFAGITTFMIVLFARGVEQTRLGTRAHSDVLNAELKIDLLRTDTLAVLGRSAARWSLIWFVVSAIACLFFVGGDLDWLTIALIVGCAAMGIGMFASVMLRIHRQIRAAKEAELEHIRGQIDAMRATMHEDGTAAARLHGMLAYEKRISDAPEWPFDQSTLVRVGASALILAVPWFGQAVAQYFVENIARVSG